MYSAHEADGKGQEAPHEAHFAAVSDLVEKSSWAELAKWDQLKRAQKAGEAFVNFTEGPLDFKPTFKVAR
jgi:hypothetical protein